MKASAVFLCIVSGLAYAQNQDMRQTPAASASNSSNLQVAVSRRLLLDGALVGKARCDDDGNIYVRVLDNESSQQYRAASKVPVRQIGTGGALGRVFSAAKVMPDIMTRDFFVSGKGRVYVMGWIPSDGTVYVFQFDTDGSFISKIGLNTGALNPRQLVVFKSGEFLVSGTNGESDHTPATAVFDAQGNLIKKIYEPEDEYSKKKAEAGDADFVQDGTNWDNLSVVHGDAALGSDGNAYLLRATSPALIYVISAKGKIIRKLLVEPPSSELIAQRIKLAEGKLAISFLENNSTVGAIKIVDLLGNPVGNYTSDDKTIYPGLPGCYDGRSFTFLQAGEGNAIRMQKAATK